MKLFVSIILLVECLFSKNYTLILNQLKFKVKKNPNILAKTILQNKKPNKIEKKLVNKNSRLKFFSSIYKGKKEYHFVIHNPNLYKKNKNNINLLVKGNAPIGIDGKKIELHHLKQKNNGLLIETSHTFHKKYHKELHPLKKSEIDRKSFNKFRKKYYESIGKRYKR